MLSFIFNRYFIELFLYLQDYKLPPSQFDSGYILVFHRILFSDNNALILRNSNTIKILCTINFEEKSNLVSISALVLIINLFIEDSKLTWFLNKERMCVLLLHFLLSAENLSTALLVGLREGEDYFHILETNRRIKVP